MKKFILFCLFTMSFNLFAFDEISPLDKGFFSLRSKSEYLVGVLGTETLSTSKITHILTPGSAKGKESNQFFQSAIARGQRYLELYPDHQVVIISAPDVKRVKNVDVFSRFKVKLIKKVKEKLTGYRLLREMEVFKNIASFDFYGHSSPWALILGSRKATLGDATGDSNMTSIRDNFISGAYATLNSCNAGLKIAPTLSENWGIPVSGAMTGSLFEALHDDDRWYNHFLKVTVDRVRTNNISFEIDRKCNDGNCWRMKPMNTRYSGYWGSWDSGLSFYKFFCNYEDKNNSCAKGMAKSLYSMPSVRALDKNAPLAEFKEVLFDHLCPTGPRMDTFDKCVSGIEEAISRGDNIYSPFKTNSLDCNSKKCHFDFNCKWSGGRPKSGSCRLSAPKNNKPTVIVNEYLKFIKGYKLL